MMDIAFIEPHLKTVGGIRRILEVSNRLQAFKHNVYIYTPTGKKCTWIKNGIPTLKLSKIHKKQFDVVIFNLAEQYPWALKAKAKRKVFWVLAPEAEYKHPTIPVQALQQNFFFVANSKYTQNYIRRHRNLKYDPPIIPGGINPNHFKFDPKVAKDYHVLYYGSARPWKGASIINKAFLSANLKILRMEGLGTPQNRMWTLYNRSTIYVSANQIEGFSFGQLEAMACGCPVLTTDDGGSRDYIVPNYNALVINRDSLSIREGTRQLLLDKDLRRKFRKNGLKTAKDSRFDWNNCTKKFEKVLFGLL